MIKHGLSRTRIYQTWADMKQRCNNPNNPFYHRYGGRGIGYIPEWNDFEAFYKWAKNSGYQEDLTLDRIDNNKGYSPDNCKWSTQQEQALNKRHNPNKYGYKGIHASIRKGKVEGYKATYFRNGKEIYIGYSKTAEGAHEIRNKYLKENNIYDNSY